MRRNHLWEDALKRFQAGFNFRKHVRVIFIREPAVDDGGPLREFLHLLMGEIATNNSLFSGQEDCRVPLPNVVGLQKLTFKHVGEMMAVSIIYGGPAPNFLAPSIVDYLLHGMGKVRATIDEVPCPIIRTKLYKVSCYIITLIQGGMTALATLNGISILMGDSLTAIIPLGYRQALVINTTAI